MEHTNESILVKVADLVPSPYNMRRHSHASIGRASERQCGARRRGHRAGGRA
jgi:hypothetical protein